MSERGATTAAIVGTVVAFATGGAVAAVTITGVVNSKVNSTLNNPDSISKVDQINYGQR